MNFYLYFICRRDGVAISLDAREFPGDAPAAAHAEALLDAHPSADRVVVRCGERVVRVRRRAPAAGAGSPRLAFDPEVAGIEAAERG